MKIQIVLMAAVAATALAGTSMAASLSDVVQKGPAAAKVMEKNQINFATAKALGDHCIAEAASKGMGVSVVIIDQFGVISYYARGDGQGKTNTESALWKAKTGDKWLLCRYLSDTSESAPGTWTRLMDSLLFSLLRFKDAVPRVAYSVLPLWLWIWYRSIKYGKQPYDDKPSLSRRQQYVASAPEAQSGVTHPRSE